MATSKAAWRAFSQTAEPRTPSQWVWLGRSTPFWWEVEWTGLFPPDPLASPRNVWPSMPPLILNFKDHAYLAQIGSGSWDTLAWEGTLDLPDYHVRIVVQQWQQADCWRSVLVFEQNNHCYLWTCTKVVHQRDARDLPVTLTPWGTGTLTSGTVTGTPGLTANAANLVAVGPPWRAPKGGQNPTNGTEPTSLILVWVA